MIDFIPLDYYFFLYLHGSLLLVLFTFLHSLFLSLDDRRNLSYINIAGYLLLIVLSIYIGLRPVSGKYFIDMRTYETHFNYYANGGAIVSVKDVFFHLFMKISASILTVNNFFLLCAVLYIYPMYRISKSLFKEYWFYAFLIFVVSFQFWPYGVNGIRNGIATSFFLLAVSFHSRRFIMVLFLVLAVLFHKSLMLPIFAFGLTFLFNKPKYILMGWVAAIPFSLVLGGYMESIFTSLGFADDRLSAYLGDESSSGGFRFDFLIYSASAVFVGWYYIFRKNFQDKLYNQIFNTYLITNAFWILIIRANFSNRFAYLSWFMIGLVIIYPFLKERFYKNQNIVIGFVLLMYFGFTYFMYGIYYSGIK